MMTISRYLSVQMTQHYFEMIQISSHKMHLRLNPVVQKLRCRCNIPCGIALVFSIIIPDCEAHSLSRWLLKVWSKAEMIPNERLSETLV